MTNKPITPSLLINMKPQESIKKEIMNYKYVLQKLAIPRLSTPHWKKKVQEAGIEPATLNLQPKSLPLSHSAICDILFIKLEQI